MADTPVRRRRPAAEVFGRVLWLGATDGEHRLGSAYAVRSLHRYSGEVPGEARQLDALLRLSEHYGDWLGFGSRTRSRGVGKVRLLGDLPEQATRIEYRIHIRRIGRRQETLIADGEVSAEGVPLLRAERIQVGP
ncbi:hypothetical protein ACE7GA_14960 [Roseomonas sp. CCTCC AB2023176]|uniref:hypothetical protein n=1 Tax=Roseomonas sp. CCTCC AB2023176 TaxID=3342640 RepID=UPI0035E2F63E